jgi:hypothetical protein
VEGLEGPAHKTNCLAMAMGFASLDYLQEVGDRIADAIAAGVERWWFQQNFERRDVLDRVAGFGPL